MIFVLIAATTTILLTWSPLLLPVTTTAAMYPPSPPLGSLRLANISDLPRIAVVATAGFYYSPVFGWERPCHRNFPQDTYRSYQSMFAEAIRDPEYIALVAEDKYEVDESERTQAIIEPGDDYTVPEPGSKVIVGVATWKLEPGSAHKGQYMDTDDDKSPNKPIFDGGQGRDKSPYHAKLLDDKCEAAEEKYFEGHQLVDMLVVHPASWRRGHGTALLNWGMELGSLDLVKQGVIAADMGEKLYLSKGYKKLDNVIVTDENDAEKGVKVGILEFVPSKSTPEL
ncbi:uncharacterized protein PV07_07676 [Cladophialophora immunda]|uniref:N-acetyltransferase domain-containing protein n=1 Tax=Cladophialophora immunda TaxID=569365 RepID=A0A0D2CWI5_9EURO|nr:uncharacterized protein PV07_07676 [Cladophialophora immunda]KIW27984.1 hypothetical protein PV07_07676 [Cladophialophora immunda]